jgi:type IV pilus assembly protein PilM
MDPWETKPVEGEKTSVWKKEISFRRKPKPAAAAAEAHDPKPSRKERRAEARLAKADAKSVKRQAEADAKLAKQRAKEDAKAAKAAKREQPPNERKPSRKERRLEAQRVAAERKQLEAEREELAAQRPRGSRSGFKRKKRLVGLKIGSSQLAAARVVNNGSADLVQIAREPLETGIVVGGEPRRPDELANALRDFFKKHKLPKTGVRLGIASNRIGVRTLEVAGITDPKQLENAIRFRAQEALPIPLEEAVLDYQVLSERVDAATGRPVRRVLLVVAYRDLIDRYVSACRKAGIRLSGIDLEAFGLLRALTTPRDPDEPARAATVVVNVGHDRSTFGVSDGLHCEFTRVLEWGGAKLGVAIARALDFAPSEAAPIKHALSLTEPVTPAGLTQEQAQKAREAAQVELHAFARELVSALQFYQNQPGSLGIGEVVLTGGTAELPGIDAELRRLIGVPVRVGDPLVNVRLGKKVDVPEDLGSLATAIGLGIGSSEALMRAVNLLPTKKDTRERRRQPNVIALGGVVAAVAVTGVLAMWFLNASGAVTERQSDVDTLRAELAAMPVPKPSDASGDALAAEKAGRLTALSAALGSRVPWDRLFREISFVTPDDVWFTTLQASAPSAPAADAAAPATAATAGGFTITGRTYSHDAVARLLSRLSIVPQLNDVKLEKSVLGKAEGRTVVEFTISAAVRAPGATS